MQNSIKHVCFDLDGTLINSCKTIYKATLKTLQYLKISGTIVENEFNEMIGYHFIHIFERLKIAVPDVEQFISAYKQFYFDFISESEIIPGAVEILENLRKKNIAISLLTTKNQEQAEKILEYFYLRDYFSFVMGRRNGLKYKPSPDPLIFICQELNIKPEETLLVGDTELDIVCGKNSKSLTCAVTFGYRRKEVLELEKPDYIISKLSELNSLI